MAAIMIDDGVVTIILFLVQFCQYLITYTTAFTCNLSESEDTPLG